MHNCVGRHFKKVQAFCTANPLMKDCFSIRIFQVVIFGVFMIVLGAVAVANPGECNTPVQVFLEGLFGLYLFGFILNLFVGCMYFCFRFNSEFCLNSWRNLQKAINLCYWPLHITFCIFEFVWFICGCVWLFGPTNCRNEMQQGATLATALIVIWMVITAICCVGSVCFNGYVWQRDANELEEAAKRELTNAQRPPAQGAANPPGPNPFNPTSSFQPFGSYPGFQGGYGNPMQPGSQHSQWDPNARVPGPLAPGDTRNQDPFYRSTHFNSTYSQPQGDQRWQPDDRYDQRDSYGQYQNYQQDYSQPPRDYSQPPQDYTQPPRDYSQPPQDYTQPPQSYTQPPQDYYADPQRNSFQPNPQYDAPRDEYRGYPPEPSGQYY